MPAILGTDLQPARQGFVRPRFDDGHFDAPLLLEDHFRELFLDPPHSPARLLLRGTRGSGLTTALRWLADLTRHEGSAEGKAGRVPVLSEDLEGDTAEAAWQSLLSGEGILFLDLSVTPVEQSVLKSAGGWLKKFFDVLFSPNGSRPRREEVVAHISLVLAFPANLDPESDLPHLLDVTHQAILTPWGWDELLELLGSCERLRERRAQVFSALKAVPDMTALVGRPRAARILVEAALRLDPEESPTLAGLYANVLDTLSPGTLEVLRKLPPGPLDIAFLEAAGECESWDPAEVIDLFDVLTPRSAARLQAGRLSELEVDFCQALLLPGLQHFLQAGDCLREVSQERVPSRVMRRWYPFLRELITPAQRQTLRGWLVDFSPAPPVAATILWATGETPALTSTTIHPLDLCEADLQGISLPGSHLVQASFDRTILKDALLEGARLDGATFHETQASGLEADGASLEGASFEGAQLGGASLRGVVAKGARFNLTKLRGSSWEGADLRCTEFKHSDLQATSFVRANLNGAKFLHVQVRGADFSQATLLRASLEKVDLRHAGSFLPLVMRYCRFHTCRMEDLVLDGIDAEEAVFEVCDLSQLSLRESRLREAKFWSCGAHGAVFDGADLRRALFQRVDFQAGSSRAGLLLDKPPLEGNMTGFYRESSSDDAWASPESLRQASFRGADLRGARFENCNLFRVDFRGAKLDPELEEDARRGGAIL